MMEHGKIWYENSEPHFERLKGILIDLATVFIAGTSATFSVCGIIVIIKGILFIAQ